MIKKLKSISGDVFEEMESHAPDSKPFEWSRSFNHIKLRLKNIEIVNGFSVQDREMVLDASERRSVTSIKQAVRSNSAITGDVDLEAFNDSIYIASAIEDEKDIFSIESYLGSIKVYLKSGSPIKPKEDEGGEGLFWGNAFRMNFEPNEDDLIFELEIPEDRLDSLICELKTNNQTILDVSALLESYTYEVDDFFRDPHNSRQIIIRDFTRCFVTHINYVSKIGKHSNESESEDDEKYNWEDDARLNENDFTEAQLQKLEPFLQPARSSRNALWVIAFVLIFILIFK